MKLFHRAPFVAKVAEASAVIIGNFDGMHLGHQALLAELCQVAHQQGLAATVIVFEPQPAEFLRADAAPGRLMRFREKYQALQTAGIDQVLCLAFDAAQAAMPAEGFVEKVLLDQLHVRHLLVGDDFRFGHRRLGDVALLQRFADQGAFSLTALASHYVDGVRVSSSRVRQALASGDLALAARLLGRPYAITERVIAGRQQGRLLQFPTINMAIHRRVTPLRGVYAVGVYHPSGQRLGLGVANLGQRPTFGGEQWLLETHIFDWQQDLYGQRLRIEFYGKLRDERKFSDLTALKNQIAEDSRQARQFLQAWC